MITLSLPSTAEVLLSGVSHSAGADGYFRARVNGRCRRPLLDDPEAVARYAAVHHRSPDQQVLGSLFLDPCCRLITDCEIFRGGLTGAAVDPGPLFRRALKASAAWVVVFQTRSTDPAPTADDWAFTRRLVEAGKILGIGIADHVIVASAERWISLHRQHPW